MVNKKQTEEQVKRDNESRIMNGVAIWCSFYRANPHRFCADYLNLELRLFQKILIFLMNLSTNFMYLAARGRQCKY